MSGRRSEFEEKLLEDLKLKIDDLNTKIDTLNKALDSVGTDSLRVKTV